MPWLGTAEAAPERAIYRAHNARRRPKVVELQWLLEVEQGKRYKYGDRDRLLQKLKLGNRELGVADAVARYLQQMFEQRPTAEIRGS